MNNVYLKTRIAQENAFENTSRVNFERKESAANMVKRLQWFVFIGFAGLPALIKLSYQVHLLLRMLLSRRFSNSLRFCALHALKLLSIVSVFLASSHTGQLRF